MARLSILDLNNLSGVSDEELDILYKNFRSAHTKLLNDLNKWEKNYNLMSTYLSKLENTSYDNDIIVYNSAREMYYKGSLLLDNIDLFEYYTAEYHSILTKLQKNKIISNIMILLNMIQVKKKEIINTISECYGLYSEAYDRINEWEDTYEG